MISASASGSVTVPTTGVSAASAVGGVSARGDALVIVTGVSSSDSIGGASAGGGATAGASAVLAAFGIGTVTAQGTTGNATVIVGGVSAASAVGAVTGNGTSTVIAVAVTEDMVCRVVRNYIKSIAPTLRVLRTPVNRADMPKDAYVSFTPGLRRPLSTNISSDTANSRAVSRSEQMSFQIDCYGVGSANLAHTLNILYRDFYTVEQFASSGLEIVPLYAGDIQQAPFVNGEDQYEDRYTFEIELQYNPHATVPLQSCNILTVDHVPVEATFPPT